MKPRRHLTRRLTGLHVALLPLALASCESDECEPGAECTSASSYRVCEYRNSGDHGGAREWRSKHCPGDAPVCHEYASSAVCHPSAARVCASEPVFTAEVPIIDAVVGDANSDSVPDLALVLGYEPNPWLAVALGNGSGDFDTPKYIDAVSYHDLPYSPVLGDITGDGIPDLGVISALGAESSTVRWWSGLGNGTFGGGGARVEGGRASGFLFADLDSDGRAEVVLSADGAGARTAVLGLIGADLDPLATLGGVGGPIAHLESDRFLVGGAVYAYKDGAIAKAQSLDERTFVEVRARDVNLDGRADVVLVEAGYFSPFRTPVHLFVTDSAGELSWKRTLELGAGLALADANADGALDVLAPSLDARVGVYLDVGGSTSALSQVFPSAPPAASIREAVVAPGLAGLGRLLLVPQFPHRTIVAMGVDCFP